VLAWHRPPSDAWRAPSGLPPPEPLDPQKPAGAPLVVAAVPAGWLDRPGHRMGLVVAHGEDVPLGGVAPAPDPAGPALRDGVAASAMLTLSGEHATMQGVRHGRSDRDRLSRAEPREGWSSPM
jgi:hypothetical protein